MFIDRSVALFWSLINTQPVLAESLSKIYRLATGNWKPIPKVRAQIASKKNCLVVTSATVCSSKVISGIIRHLRKTNCKLSHPWFKSRSLSSWPGWILLSGDVDWTMNRRAATFLTDRQLTWAWLTSPGKRFVFHFWYYAPIHSLSTRAQRIIIDEQRIDSASLMEGKSRFNSN